MRFTMPSDKQSATFYYRKPFISSVLSINTKKQKVPTSANISLSDHFFLTCCQFGINKVCLVYTTLDYIKLKKINYILEQNDK